MPGTTLFSPQMSILEQSLYASSLRHKVISNNIANVNTPGFKKSEVAFEDLLQAQLDGKETSLPLARTNSRHLSGGNGTSLAPRVNTIGTTSFRTDDNNVDIDIEMADLAKNNIYYNAVAQQLSRQLSNLKSAIREGRS
jgi:flagellar basal-body rod protein FlgB